MRTTSKGGLVALVVAVATVIAACGGSSQNARGPVAVQDRGRATAAAGTEFDDQGRCEYKGRDDREANETAGPGAILPNVRKVYAVVGTGDDRRKVLVCREIDTNLDGVKDVVRTFNEKGEALHEEADSNYDGRIDTWITFNQGRIQKEAVDSDGDGQPDEWHYYVNGVLARVERDTNKDGKPDVFEFYQNGHLERSGVDLDFDGHVDRWDHDEVARKAQDAIDRAAERSAGATGQAQAAPTNVADDGAGGAGGAGSEVLGKAATGPKGGKKPKKGAGGAGGAGGSAN